MKRNLVHGVLAGLVLLAAGCSARPWQTLEEDFFSRIRPARGNAEAHALLAAYYQEQDRHREAVRELLKVIEIRPDAKIYNRLGVSYDRLGEFAEAMAAYRAALDLDPSLDYVYNNIGYSCLLRGRYRSAAAAFEQALALNGGNALFRNNLALAQAGLKRGDRARETLAKGVPIALWPPGPEKPIPEKQGERIPLINQMTMNQTMLNQTMINQAMKTQVMKTQAKPDGPDSTSRQAEPAEAEPAEAKPAAASPVTPPGGIGARSGPPSRVRTCSARTAAIEVANGNGVPGLAGAAASRLARKGYRVVSVINAKHFGHSRSDIYFLGGCEDLALRVSRELGGIWRLIRVDGFKNPKTAVKVILGRNTPRLKK